MTTIICTRHNASESINGITFKRRDDGAMIAHDVPEEMAGIFLSIDGYVNADHEPGTEAAKDGAPRRGRPPKNAPEE